MDRAKIEHIQEGAYFFVDLSSFETTIAGYDSLIANQTVLFSWDIPRLEEERSPPVKVQEIHQERELP